MGALYAVALAAALAPWAPAASLDFQSIFRGNGAIAIGAIAADPYGNVYVTGTTTAFDFPVTGAYQPRNPGSAIVVSDDAGRTWRPLGFIPDVPFTGVNAPAVHPRRSDLLIASGVYGIYRSTDAGGSWSTVVDLNRPAERERIGYIDTVMFDPRDPSLVYAAATGGVLKSADAGATWTLLAAGLAPGHCCTGAGIAVDPFQPGRLIYTINERAYVSLDAGATWRGLVLPQVERPFILTDPHTAGVWYLYSYEGAWRSADAGASWLRMPVGSGLFRWLLADPSLPGRLYALAADGFFRSSDGGATWEPLVVETPLDPMSGSYGFTLAMQPGNPDYLVISGQTTGDFGRTVNLISTDGGKSWQPMGAIRRFHGFQFDPSRPTRLYAAGTPTADAFIAKLNPSGRIVFSTYLGGQGEDSAAALALDGQGNIYVAGRTQSPDFPAASARHYPGFAPSLFAAKLNAAGRPVYVTLFGDGANDAVHAIAVDATGRLHLTGSTVSPRFPLTANAIGGFAPNGGGFAARLSPDGGSFEYSTALTGFAASIAVDPEGGFLLGGSMTQGGAAAELLRFSDNGVLLQAARLPVVPAKLLAAPAGRVFVAGNALATAPPPVSPGAFQTTIDTNCPHNSGGLFTRPQLERPRYMTDVWVAQLDRNAAPLWAALLGGACREDARDLALAPDGSLWVAGETYSQNLPVVDPLFGPPVPEFSVPFVARLDAGGLRLLLSTWLDYGSSPFLAAPPCGAVYVGSSSPSRNYSGPAEGTLRRISPAPAPGPAVRRVVNAFDGRDGPVAPLEIVLLEVPALLPTAEINLGLNPAGGAPTELGGVEVEFNGVRARLLDVWRGGLICITPAALRGQSLAEVVVLQGGVPSGAFYVPVIERKLVFFPQVRNQDGSLNSPDNPARAGSLVTFFFTGAGALDGAAELLFQTPAQERVPLPPLRSVPGFVEGLYYVQLRAPAAEGTFTVRAFFTEGRIPYPAALSTSVSVSVR